ncbi:unnamed protein product [Ectocarpus sp. CCAP 1310/34]|nr:unnamed protein product [Ectocarpus sp. CCAP 1310/34]
MVKVPGMPACDSNSAPAVRFLHGTAIGGKYSNTHTARLTRRYRCRLLEKAND